MQTSNINLLHTSSAVSAEPSGVKGFRTASSISLGIVLLLGVPTLASYIILRNQVAALTRRKTELVARISQDLAKEGIFISVKDRLKSVKNIQDKQHPWTALLETITEVAPITAQPAVTVDDKQLADVTLTAGSLEEAGETVARVVNQLANKKVEKPQLTGLSVDKKGVISLSLSFTLPGQIL